MPLILHLGNEPGQADRCFLATADMSITVKQAIQIVPKSNLGEGRGKHHTLYFCISRLIQNPQETLWMAAMTIQTPLPCDWPILLGSSSRIADKPMQLLKERREIEATRHLTCYQTVYPRLKTDALYLPHPQTMWQIPQWKNRQGKPSGKHLL